MSLYRRLLQFVKPYWLKLILAVICMVAVSFLTAATAWLFKPVVDGVFFRKEGMSSITIPPFVNNIIVHLHLEDLLLKRGMEMLRLLPILLILLYLLKGIFNYGQAYFMNFVGLRIIADVREKLYNHLQTLSLSFFTKTPTGIIISRITNDVAVIQGAVSSTTAGVFKDIFTFFGLVAVAFLPQERFRIPTIDPALIVGAAVWLSFARQRRAA